MFHLSAVQFKAGVSGLKSRGSEFESHSQHPRCVYLAGTTSLKECTSWMRSQS